MLSASATVFASFTRTPDPIIYAPWQIQLLDEYQLNQKELSTTQNAHRASQLIQRNSFILQQVQTGGNLLDKLTIETKIVKSIPHKELGILHGRVYYLKKVQYQIMLVGSLDTSDFTITTVNGIKPIQQGSNYFFSQIENIGANQLWVNIVHKSGKSYTRRISTHYVEDTITNHRNTVKKERETSSVKYFIVLILISAFVLSLLSINTR